MKYHSVISLLWGEGVALYLQAILYTVSNAMSMTQIGKNLSLCDIGVSVSFTPSNHGCDIKASVLCLERTSDLALHFTSQQAVGWTLTVWKRFCLRDKIMLLRKHH